jgi:hypothetical protein
MRLASTLAITMPEAWAMRRVTLEVDIVDGVPRIGVSCLARISHGKIEKGCLFLA